MIQLLHDAVKGRARFRVGGLRRCAELGNVPDDDIAVLIERHFDFRLAAIVKDFNLRHLPANSKGSFYQKLATYGHVGRTDIDLPWEKIDKIEELRDAVA